MKRVIRGLALVMVCHACVFEASDFTRTADLGDGEIRARFARDDGKPASGTLVSLHGSARAGAANEQGDVVITDLYAGRWLMKVTEDDEGDGIPERGVWLPVELAVKEIPRNITDGCTGDAPSSVTSVVLGDVTPVALPATGSLSGTLDVPAGQQGRVVVTRDVDGYATSVEAAAGVDVDGNWRVDGLIASPEEVRVTAFLFDPAAGGPNAPLTFGTATARVGDDDVALTADQDALLDGGGARRASAQFEAQWNLDEAAAITVTQSSFVTPVDGNLIPGVLPDENPVPLDDTTRAFVLDPPIGVIDVSFASDTAGASGGLLRHVVSTPETGLTLGPVDFPAFIDACAVTNDDDVTVRDCDRDGLTGLDPVADVDALTECVDACVDAFGADNAQATCEAVGAIFDCDDDGDGQPDVTEFAGCVGPGLGTDLDSDDLCEPGQDPFPYCAADDLADCPAAFSPPASRY